MGAAPSNKNKQVPNNNTDVRNKSQITTNKNNYQNYAISNQSTEKQIQTQIQKSQEIEYYVYEDLTNFLGVLVDVQETLNHFKNSKDHAYLPIALNRLIIQSNLSNLIHFDCYHRYKSEQGTQYDNEKEIAKEQFTLLKQQIVTGQTHEIVDKCIKSYENNLKKGTKPILDQQTMLVSNYKSEFNSQVVQKIFEGIQQVDQKQYEIKRGEYKKLTQIDIKNIINQRRERAQRLLNQNFPQKTIKDNQKSAIKSSNPSYL